METQTAAMNEIQFRDIEIKSLSGWLGILIHLIVVPVIGLVCFAFYAAGPIGVALGVLLQLIISILWFVMWNSYVVINPNEAAVCQFFGKYVGSVKTEGFRWFVNPLYEKTKVIFRIRNFESAKLKVNDVNANPIDIAAVVVWRVFDAAEALFEVDDYENYVQIQSEAALRAMATKYPYDIIEE
ncbi:MAG: SPFH domain-containing protein, partial [Candidatus Poseidoniaceae archaeon]|nr:SPFH domain-containing protein [Candidatus Poseidoniaceae archaeon]